MNDRAFPRHGYPIPIGGVDTGHVTSGTFSPTLERGIGMGYVPADHATVGSGIEVIIRNKPVPATIVSLPFVKKGSMTGFKIHLTPHLVDELALRDKVVVVVDVLRAGTVYAVALHNGAREVIPTATVDAAARVSSNLAGAITMLAGERNGKMIEGFHFGNSPLEFTAGQGHTGRRSCS